MSDITGSYKTAGLAAVALGWSAVAWAGNEIGGWPGLALAIGLPLMAWGISTISAMLEVETREIVRKRENA